MFLWNFAARIFSVIVSMQSDGLHLHDLIIFASNNPDFFVQENHSNRYRRCRIFLACSGQTITAETSLIHSESQRMRDEYKMTPFLFSPMEPQKNHPIGVLAWYLPTYFWIGQIPNITRSVSSPLWIIIPHKIYAFVF